MNRVFRCVYGLALVLAMAATARAEVRLPTLFSNHMVLQAEAEANVWGWANAGEKVTVSLAGQTREATAGDNGRWQVTLDPLPAGGPHVLSVQGENTIQVEDVLVGEVWLGSGQSNMAMTVSRAADFDQEKAAANLPQIRMFTVERKVADEPQEDCQGQWVIATPETVGNFSATLYFFGRTLHEELKTPVGLINSSWGGTPIEAWIDVSMQQTLPELEPMLKRYDESIAAYDPEKAQAAYEKSLQRWKQAAQRARTGGETAPRRPQPPVDPKLAPRRPGVLYNGMIAPLVPYTLRGFTWYQGEANANRGTAELYGLQLKTLIANWRGQWKDNELPMLFVQLPNYLKPQQQPSETAGWVLVREEMLQTLRSVANTGMAVTVDIGEAEDIHPKNKQDVGRRLARWARAQTYGKDVAPSGPLYKSMEKRDGKIVIRFDYADGGLVAQGDGRLEGFAIAGDDRQFVWADAKIEGETVVVSSPEVKAPQAVRYAWATNPKANLVNRAGLPASPFRTDEWEE